MKVLTLACCVDLERGPWAVTVAVPTSHGGRSSSAIVATPTSGGSGRSRCFADI